VRHTRLTDKPARPKIRRANHDTEDPEIDWGERRLSRYPLAWLRSHCLSPQARARHKFEPSLRGSEMAGCLPYMNYAEVAASEDMQLQFLESILYHGFAISRDVPAARERTGEITSLVGKRHIRSCRVGLDEFYSRLRILYAERQDPRRWITFRKD
jgi:hypothetical protein